MSYDAGNVSKSLADLPAPERGAHAYRRLFALSGDRDRTFTETVEAMLEIGCEWFGTPFGFLGATDEDLTIVTTHGDADGFETGTRIPMGETYCRFIVADGSLVAINDAERDGYADDPTYTEHGVRCYIGTAVKVDGEQFGTLCFMGEEPRERGFDDEDERFLETLAEWLGTALERRNRERELERRRDRLSEFPGFVAHELRNPLAIALGQLELSDPDFDTVERALTTIDTRIDSLLTLSKSEQPVADAGDVAVGRIARAAWSDLGGRPDALTVESDRTVRGDAQRVRTLVENLLKNALTHGGPDVTVTLRATTEGFAVDDDGPGIPESSREAVFERGHSGGDSTGLGLAIVDRIADAHGWDAVAGESPDGGARIELRTRVRGEEF
ncbi:sensor histidine kinase [Natronomonas sp. EA1]|uniref:sensor histidine kinase n=1 Tax=Natronomonas sp. EA1 TaxID=3421655 RepID=UPI003EB9273B